MKKRVSWGLVPLRVLKPKMTAARVVSVRFMTILSKSSWEESVQKSCFLLLKFAVRVEMNFGDAHKTRCWYLLAVLPKFSDEHPCPFYRRVPPPPPGVEVYRLTKLLGSLSSSVFERRTSTGSELFASLGSGLVETPG